MPNTQTPEPRENHTTLPYETHETGKLRTRPLVKTPTEKKLHTTPYTPPTNSALL